VFKKLSVIIPACNEVSVIYKNLIDTVKTINKFDIDYEIIAVDDGSTDGTYQEMVKASTKSNKIRLVHYKKNVGKGLAVIRGFKEATGDLITFIDADLEIHPQQIKKFIDIILSAKVDIVLGSKRHPNSIVNYPTHRKFLSYCYFILNYLLFRLPIKDTQVGLKLYKREVLDKIISRMVVKGYAFDLEMLVLAYKFGYTMIEVPITLNFKRGFGRIRLKDIWRILIDTLGIAYRLRVKNQ